MGWKTEQQVRGEPAGKQLNDPSSQRSRHQHRLWNSMYLPRVHVGHPVTEPRWEGRGWGLGGCSFRLAARVRSRELCLRNGNPVAAELCYLYGYQDEFRLSRGPEACSSMNVPISVQREEIKISQKSLVVTFSQLSDDQRGNGVQELRALWKAPIKTRSF